MNCTGKNCIMQYDKVDPATCPCVPYCPQATPPKTNADKIRQMTDEELSVLLNNQRYWPDWCDDNCQTACRDCCLKWLKEEVEDGSI